MECFDIAVVGAGGAGIMAYLRGVLNRDRCVLFKGDRETRRKGRATWVAEVDNIPGMHGLKSPITSTGKSTLAWLASQEQLADRQKVIDGAVTSIHREPDGRFKLFFEGPRGATGQVLARQVINATGLMDVQPHIAGSIKPILPYANNYDVLYCIRCDGHKTIGRKLAVFGHRDTAPGIAAILMERYEHKTAAILTNGAAPEFSESSKDLMAAYGMELRTEPLTAIRGDSKKPGGLEGFELEGGDFVSSTVAVVALGIIAANKLAKDLSAELDPTGRIKVDSKFESTVPGFFVVGDLVPNKKMQIYTAWDEAVDAADEINRRLRIERREALVNAWRQKQEMEKNA